MLDRTHDLRGEILAIDDPVEAWEPIRLRVWLYARDEARQDLFRILPRDDTT